MGRVEGDRDLFGIPRSIRNEIWLVGLRVRLRTEQSRRIVDRARAQAQRTHWICARARKRRLKLQTGARRGRVLRLRRG
jgi:hypothetical protein